MLKRIFILLIFSMASMLLIVCDDNDSSGSDNPIEDISLRVTYTKCSRSYDLRPGDGGSINLGEWQEGQDLIAEFTLTNNGTDPVDFSSMSLISIFTDARSNDMDFYGVVVLPVTLNQNDSTSFDFSFAPDNNASLDSHYESLLSIIIEDVQIFEVTIYGDSVDYDVCN